MPINYFFNLEPAQNDTIWSVIKDNMPTIVSIAGWVVILISNLFLQKSKLKLDIQVKAAEEALIVLNEMYCNHIEALGQLYYLKFDIEENAYGEHNIDIFYKTIDNIYQMTKELKESNRIYSFVETREIIFCDFIDEVKNLNNSFVSLDMKYNDLFKLVKQIKEDHELNIKQKLEIIAGYFNNLEENALEATKLTFKLRRKLQKKFLSKLFGKCKWKEYSEEELEEKFSAKVIYL